jgi:DHA3 family macrolide efflux protein-like MFS transporter
MISRIGGIIFSMNRIYTFYLLVTTQTLSLTGSRMTAIGLGIWLFRRTSDTTPLLLMAFFNELPGMLGGSLAGVLVDRWDRRRVLMLADAGQAAGTLLLLSSVLAGRFQSWHLYLVVLVQGAFATLQQPARNAATTMLVPEGHRDRANALQEMSFPLAGVIAPVLAGALYAWIDVSGIMLVDLATFLVAIAVAYLVRIPRPAQTAEGRAARGSVWQEMLGGLHYFGRRRALLGLVLYLTAINFLLNGPLELAIPYLIAVTGSETLTGGLMGLMSLGALAGATLIAIWGGTRPRMHTLLPGLLLTGVMFLVYGTARTLPVLGLSLFVLMIPLPISNALFVSILQAKTPPDMQGRIFAVVSQMGFLGATASFLLTGPLVDRVLEPAVGGRGWRFLEPIVGRQAGAGMGLVLVGTGLMILLATAAMYGLPRIRQLEAALPDYKALADRA